jgi:superfamily II DNA or RNA helicase
VIKLEINNNFCKFSSVDNEQGLKSLYKDLSFRHPEAFYMQRKLKYTWDGFVHPLNKKGRLKTGLLQTAIDILVEYEEEYMVLDHRVKIQTQDIPSELGGLTPYGFQTQGVEALFSNYVLEQLHPRAVIPFSVGAGKTLMMFMIHATVVNARTIIVVDRKPLFDQLLNDAYKVFGKKVGYINAKDIVWGELMVCMLMSLSNRLQTQAHRLQEYNVLLVDEPDSNLGSSMESVVLGLPNTTVRVGFSGSVFVRDKELKKDILINTKLRELFGEPIFKVTAKDLEDEGVTTKVIIKLIKGNRLMVSGLDFNDEFKSIACSPRRFEQIYNRIMYNWKGGRRHIFIFTRFIQQTEDLYHFLRERLPSNIGLGFSHHKMVGNVLDLFKEGKINVLVTSLYLKRGINVPNIEVIINNSGGLDRNPIQIFGRGVRRMPGKEIWYFEDFMDINCTYLHKHSKDRIKLYKTLKLEVRNYSLIKNEKRTEK